MIAERRQTLYLDLESPSDLAKLTDAELYLLGHEEQVGDPRRGTAHPGLFQTLRGLIDCGKRKGIRSGRFLLLGSASLDLLQHSSEGCHPPA